MMDTTVPNKCMPMRLAELLPGLSGTLSKEAKQTLTEKKQPRLTIATLTTEKVLRPMTIAEMRADIRALKKKSPRMFVQGTTSSKKRWNSSVKVEKKVVSHTAAGKMKNNSVRKVLTFQPPKSKIEISNAQMKHNSETPKFREPAKVAEKPMYLKALNPIRISGICHIAETPVLSEKPVKSRMTLANKENFPNQTVINKKIQTPKSSFHNQIMLSRIPDTPISTVSWNSSCDASFLQNEKDTEFIEDQIKTLPNEEILSTNIAAITPISTPFKEYRNVKEFFNNSIDVMDNSTTAYHDNTIMSFDKTSKENSLHDTSIVSLCDMLNKATVSKSNTEKTSLELDDLLGMQKRTENNIKMIENGIKILNNIKESEHKSLLHIKTLINEKQKETSESEKNKCNNTFVFKATKDIPTIHVEGTPIKSPVVARQCSVIKSCLKSPSYKLPKKNVAHIRKKVLFHKSLPDVSKLPHTPPQGMGTRALSMYMKMKKDMNFISTPVVNKFPMETPDTPAITSHNLQIQLDKLYDKN